MRLLSRLLTTSSDEVLAEYLWGRRTLVLNEKSVLTQGLYGQALAGLSAGILPARTDAEFLALAALIHELAHCLQDATTGVGFWDWLVRKEMLPKSLELGRNGSWGLDWSTQHQALQNEYRNRSLINAIGWGTDPEVDALRSGLADIIDFHNSGPNAVESFGTLNVLELEATFATHTAISSLRISTQQKEILDRNHAAFSLLDCPNTELFYTMFRCLIPEEIMQAERMALNLESVETLGTYFLDIALAMPPPGFIQRSGLTFDDFRPGIRLARMLQAFKGMSAETARSIPREEGPNGWYRFIDAVCRKTLNVTYPSVQEIYQAWIEELEVPAASGSWSESADQMRDICKRRISMNYQVWSRLPWTLLELEIPYSTRIDDFEDAKGTRFGTNLTEAGARVAIEERSSHVLDAISNTILGVSAPFVCPLATRTGGVCKAQTDRCMSGVKRISETPSTTECVVHAQLKHIGWNDRTMFTPDGAPDWA